MSPRAYKPLGIVFSVLGGLVAGAVFKRVWRLLTGNDDVPSAGNSDYGWREVLVAAAIHGAVFGAVKAAVDRIGARGFQRVTGVWPGE